MADRYTQYDLIIPHNDHLDGLFLLLANRAAPNYSRTVQGFFSFLQGLRYILLPIRDFEISPTFF